MVQCTAVPTYNTFIRLCSGTATLSFNSTLRITFSTPNTSYKELGGITSLLDPLPPQACIFLLNVIFIPLSTYPSYDVWLEDGHNILIRIACNHTPYIARVTLLWRPSQRSLYPAHEHVLTARMHCRPGTPLSSVGLSPPASPWVSPSDVNHRMGELLRGKAWFSRTLKIYAALRDRTPCLSYKICE